MALTCAVQHNCRLRDLCHGPKRAPEKRLGTSCASCSTWDPLGAAQRAGAGCGRQRWLALGCTGLCGRAEPPQHTVRPSQCGERVKFDLFSEADALQKRRSSTPLASPDVTPFSPLSTARVESASGEAGSPLCVRNWGAVEDPSGSATGVASWHSASGTGPTPAPEPVHALAWKVLSAPPSTWRTVISRSCLQSRHAFFAAFSALTPV